MAANYQIFYLDLDLARSLKPGDIIEGTYFGFWHPYVIESVLPHDFTEADAAVTVRVIHYGRQDLLERISLIEENLTLDLTTAKHYRQYRFPEADCRQDEDVVRLAKVRIGETQHSILWNNATYFALSCKLKDEQTFERYKKVIGPVRIYNPFW